MREILTESHTFECDGHQITLQKIPGRASLLVLNRLKTVLGPTIAEAVKGLGSNDLAKVDFSAFAPAVEKFCGLLSDADLEFFTNRFFEGALIDDKPLDKVINSQDPFVLIRALVEAVKFNYAGFMRVFGSAIPGLKTLGK